MDGKPDLSGDDCDPGTGRPDYHDGYAGYEYRRDDDMALWSSADLTYSITYEM
ncbi:phage minor tail protein [Escherichia coli]|uniref:Phage minor tail protein n=1 Tax=Escherichia coli TaxID=562 RepID=A0A376U7A8_ECOLX|nr:phage minor tail protein [Escherichia coli]